MLLALDYLHSQNIVHRDIKLENVLLDGKGYVRLTDFNVAKMMEERRTFSMKGTLFCMAPEVILKKGHDTAADFWSYGVFIFELLTGGPPFYSSDKQELKRQILGMDPRRYNLSFPPDMPTACRMFLSQLLVRDPRLRLGARRSDVSIMKAHPFFGKSSRSGNERPTRIGIEPFRIEACLLPYPPPTCFLFLLPNLSCLLRNPTANRSRSSVNFNRSQIGCRPIGLGAAFAQGDPVTPRAVRRARRAGSASEAAAPSARVRQPESNRRLTGRAFRVGTESSWNPRTLDPRWRDLQFGRCPLPVSDTSQVCFLGGLMFERWLTSDG